MRWLVAALVCLPIVASAQEGFQLPSGNIFCEMEEGAIRCDIVNYSYTPPPKPQDCEFDWGHSVAVGPVGAARLLCGGDTVVNRGARRLRYGTAWQGPGLTCTATQAMLRCANAAGQGFEFARTRLQLF
ncbi:DUF6636 domain-containing protein [Falsiroseomonas sp. HC035]|uniref:DUF6636 domain-containing protein n=1 Tax=Falsiroseomonas sp. HC035 TaxID=3390999 RepID=UPI003D31A153